MMFAIVSFIPSDTARPPIPSAVKIVVGLMPNTGCSTVPTANVHTTARRILMKIEAFGTCERSSTLLTIRVSALSITAASSATTMSRMIFPELVFSQSTAISIGSMVFWSVPS